MTTKLYDIIILNIVLYGQFKEVTRECYDISQNSHLLDRIDWLSDSLIQSFFPQILYLWFTIFTNPYYGTK